MISPTIATLVDELLHSHLHVAVQIELRSYRNKNQFDQIPHPAVFFASPRPVGSTTYAKQPCSQLGDLNYIGRISQGYLEASIFGHNVYHPDITTVIFHTPNYNQGCPVVWWTMYHDPWTVFERNSLLFIEVLSRFGLSCAQHRYADLKRRKL